MVTHLNLAKTYFQLQTLFISSLVVVTLFILVKQNVNYFTEPENINKRAMQQKKFPFHGIYHHITNCVCYKSNLKDYLENYENLAGPLKITKFQMKNEFYQTHFKIVQKNFRTTTERLQSEAYHIRINRPDLNDQTESRKYFKLF